MLNNKKLIAIGIFFNRLFAPINISGLL